MPIYAPDMIELNFHARTAENQVENALRKLKTEKEMLERQIVALEMQIAREQRVPMEIVSTGSPSEPVGGSITDVVDFVSSLVKHFLQTNQLELD